MALSKNQIVTLFHNLIRSYHFNDMMARRMVNGQLIGFYHPGEGQLAPGVAAASFLNKTDYLSPHHRAHGQAHMISKGIPIKHYLAEHLGKIDGCCKGRSSYHWSFPEYGVFLMSGFIGYNFSPVLGWGWSAKQEGKGRVVFNCSGDGSYGQGRAHESMLMAMNWKLPIIYWCENNGMAIHSTAEEMHPMPDISSLASGYGMPATIVDGQDVFACAEVAIEVTERARAGKGPTFVECKTMRFREHDIGTPDLSGWENRTEEEFEEMQKREPVALATERVLADGVLSQDEIDAFHEDAEQEVAEAEAFAEESPLSDTIETRESLIAGVFAN